MVDTQIGIQSLLPALFIASLPAVAGIVWFVHFKKAKVALAFVMLSGLLIRLIMISADPFLHDWDERFHALVAKHLMEFPFKPMLRLDPIMTYDPASWCCNHIWVHKQPLFLWQMALSMGILGESLMALRLPSVIMGVLCIPMVFSVAKSWLNDTQAAFIAALLAALSFYQIELTTGRFLIDHNDVAFTFYITVGIWAFAKYINSRYPAGWAILIGLAVGCAILVKWLTALLIIGGWGLYIVLDADMRKQMTGYMHLLMACVIACCVFIPWQIYIRTYFPIESAASYAENIAHITQVLGGHGGDVLYHVDQLKMHYRWGLVALVIPGIYYAFQDKQISRALTISMLGMVCVLFLFFSVFVSTKMTAFTFPVQAIILSLIGLGCIRIIDKLTRNLHKHHYQIILTGFLIGLSIYVLRVQDLVEARAPGIADRDAKVHNTEIYTSLPVDQLGDRIILNCKSFEDVELMFYQDVNAYHWWPEEHVLDSLQNLGYRFAAFRSHTNQHLPEYITADSSILIIEEELK